MEVYFQIAAKVLARDEEARLYREAVRLEPDVGPWGFKVKAFFMPDHWGTPRGYTEVHFEARGHKFIYFLNPGDDFRSIHLQQLMKMTKPKVKSVPNITGKRDEPTVSDDIHDHRYDLVSYPAR